MEQTLLDMLFQKETVFFALFLYLFWVQQQDKKEQSSFIKQQQNILGDLANSLHELRNSFSKLADNQEKLTNRIENIEIKLNEKEQE